MINFLFLSLIFVSGLITGGCVINRQAVAEYRKMQTDYSMKLRLRDEGRTALYAR